mgnify:FL=1
MIKTAFRSQYVDANQDEGTVVRSLIDYLDKDPREWYLVWGYQYFDDERKINREGDILLLGPDGGILIIEVKGFNSLIKWRDGTWPAQNAPTGKKKGKKNPPRPDPFSQLAAQQSAVIKQMDEIHGPRPYVHAVIGLPNIPEAGAAWVEASYLASHKNQMLFANDLKDFEGYWKRVFSKVKQYLAPEAIPQVIESPLFKEVTTGATEALMALISHRFASLAESQFAILDYVSHAQRLLITGGAGSGKTALLLRRTLALIMDWFSPDTPPRSLLFLTYNRALCNFLKNYFSIVRGLRPETFKKVSVDVLSWEELARQTLIDIGYEGELPDYHVKNQDPYIAAMRALLEAKGIQPRYHALVVDEAQDHNTEMDGTSHGWWDFYKKLVIDWDNAPIYVAGDESQRQYFVDRSLFSMASLKKWMGNDVHRLDCPAPLRYTQPIWSYLRTFSESGLEGSIDFTATSKTNDLPIGPDVIEPAVTTGMLDESVSSIALEWINEGQAKPEDILLLTRLDTLRQSGLNMESIGTYPLVPYEERGKGKIAYLPAPRCKGLDCKAVIVAGFDDYKSLQPGWRHTFCLAVSRAREMLAVVNRSRPKTA